MASFYLIELSNTAVASGLKLGFLLSVIRLPLPEWLPDGLLTYLILASGVASRVDWLTLWNTSVLLLLLAYWCPCCSLECEKVVWNDLVLIFWQK